MLMKNSWLEEYKNIEENIMKDVKKHFRLKKLKKTTNNTAIEGIRNLGRRNQVIFWSNNLIEYKVRATEKLPVKKYINKIISYLQDIINNLKKSDTWKIQLTNNQFYFF